jgi:hypothetical protein
VARKVLVRLAPASHCWAAALAPCELLLHAVLVDVAHSKFNSAALCQMHVASS